MSSDEALSIKVREMGGWKFSFEIKTLSKHDWRHKPTEIFKEGF